MVWCKLVVGSETLLVGCIYRPPYSKHDINEEINSAIGKAKALVSSGKYSDLLIAGDFNYPKIRWDYLHGFVFGRSLAGLASAKFIETLEENFLVQHVMNPTFGASILDLVISHKINSIYSVQVGAPVGSSDKNKLHQTLSWNFMLKSEPINKSIVKFRYDKGAYTAMNKFIDCSVCESRLWQTSTDVNELCLDLAMLYNAAMNSFVPKVVISAEKSATIKSPDAFYSMKMNPKDKQKRVDFNKVSRRVKFEVRKARLNHEIKIIEGSKRRPKCIFAFINDQTRCRDKIKPIKDSNGDLVMDKTVITNILNFKFQQAFSKDTGEPLPELPNCSGPAGSIRGYQHRMSKQLTRINQREHFILNRVVDNWNKLPPEVVKASSENLFKKMVDEINSSQQLEE
ncbi:RNA-directed DNA polymerase from mobile element jockey-like [Brachionus plicatilis]|uniref:RNA-directed DNA polymerase from mobile element jockey-like n=1 Tax=Brachionus plicatilis TaxID=10195 RepID=A0A3M7S586_BRAPC|nr:RNA-directed DNA polymerase from mobile element jockey-like [Brachionus plicatilis]